MATAKSNPKQDNGKATSGAMLGSIIGSYVTVRSASNAMLSFEGELRGIDEHGIWLGYNYRGADFVTMVPLATCAAVECKAKPATENGTAKAAS